MRLLYGLIVAGLLSSIVPAWADDGNEEGIETHVSQLAAIDDATSPPQKIHKTLQGITFDSNYDNGSLFDIIEAGTDQFTATLYNEVGELYSYFYWFRFRILDAAGRTVAINIDHLSNERPAIRTGNGPWRRMTASEAPNNSRIILTFGPDDNEAEIAYFIPLGFEETCEEVSRRVRQCEGATTEVLGQSAQGRNLWFVAVTDPSTSGALKHRVWVHSRAHSGEATGTHVMLGFLGAFTEDSPLGRHLRKYCILNVVPLLNCDGVWLGQSRWDSQGIDPERQWCFPERIPEVAALRRRVDQLMASSNPIELSLNLHSTQGSFSEDYFIKHLQPSVPAEFEAIQQRYIDAVAHATPLFVDYGNNSQLPHIEDCPAIPREARTYIESYYWNHWGDKVMALTHESFYSRRITDNEWLLSEDLQELGRGMAVALIEYFNLPPPQEPLPSGWLLH